MSDLALLELSEQFEKKRLRLDRIFFLGAHAIDESLPIDFVYAFDENPSGISKALSISTAKLTKAVKEGSLRRLLRQEGKLMWLIECSTPVQMNDASGFMSYSWAHYVSNWIYAETIESCMNQAMQWQADVRSNK